MSRKNNEHVDYFLQGFFLRKETIQVLQCKVPGCKVEILIYLFILSFIISSFLLFH